MPLTLQTLGGPASDNGLLVSVDTGQSIHRLLFDCGEGLLRSLKISEIQAIEQVFFSHFHMDHVAGFDSFFRHTYNRPYTPVQVWGPPETISVMANRFRAFIWNLHKRQAGEWIISEVNEEVIGSARFLTREAFAKPHHLPDRPRGETALWSQEAFHVEGHLLPHGSISSLACRVVEADRQNIAPDRLLADGYKPGPWLKALTDPDLSDDENISAGESTARLGDLRDAYVMRRPGDSCAYLTDFRIEPGTVEWDRACKFLEGTKTLVCECQYLDEDDPLASRNGHMSSSLVGQLAQDAKVGELRIQHLSRRYSTEQWQQIRDEVGSRFGKTSFPDHWRL